MLHGNPGQVSRGRSLLVAARGWLLILLLLGGLSAARASEVYTQPHNGTGTIHLSSWWDPDGSDYDQVVWDSFELAGTQAITEIRWRGGHDPAYVYWTSPVVDFTVAIWANNGALWQPDVIHVPLAEYQAGSTCGETPAGRFGGVALSDYHHLVAGGEAPGYLRHFDGVNWQPFGGGVDGQVNALALYNGELIAAGYFTECNGPANYIAQWDGSSWSPLGGLYGGGSTSAVCALLSRATDCVAGGIFYGNVSAWTEAGTTLEPVHDLTISASGPDAVLSWTPTGAPEYHVYSADLAAGPFATWLGTAYDGQFTESGVLGSATARFYQVRAATP